MTTFTRAIEINASKEEVWKAIAKFGDICHAHPAVAKSFVTSTQQEGIGATRHCDFTMMGASAEERVSAWDTGNYLKIEVENLKKMPGIKTMSADFTIQAKGDHTLLTSTMEYSMKNAFFDVMNTLVMKKMNAKLLDGIVAGHKKYIETGERVDEKTKLERNKVIVVK